MNKPNKQTIVPSSFVSSLMTTLPLSRLRGFGGKLGQQLKTDFGITFAGELVRLGEATLSTRYELPQCKWMIAAARGELDEPVTPRTVPEVVTCGKTFRGATSLSVRGFSTAQADTVVLIWIKELCSELIGRLTALASDHSRIAKQGVVSFTLAQPGNPSFQPLRLTKSFALPVKYDSDSLSQLIHGYVKQCLTRSSLSASDLPSCRITELSVGGNSFETRVSEKHAINHYFSPPKITRSQAPSVDQIVPEAEADPVPLTLPKDVDPDVFNSLPESLQNELREFYQTQRVSSQHGVGTKRRISPSPPSRFETSGLTHFAHIRDSVGRDKKKKADGISKYFPKVS
jgi:nucleotidyltransferase/DNA polymerase involved in DNA repair